MDKYFLMLVFNQCNKILFQRFANKFQNLFQQKNTNCGYLWCGKCWAQSASLRIAGGHNHCFIDDNLNLINRNINGIKIFFSKSLVKFKSNIDQVLLAIPSLTRIQRRRYWKDFKKKIYSSSNSFHKRYCRRKT